MNSIYWKYSSKSARRPLERRKDNEPLDVVVISSWDSKHSSRVNNAASHPPFPMVFEVNGEVWIVRVGPLVVADRNLPGIRCAIPPGSIRSAVRKIPEFGALKNRSSVRSFVHALCRFL